MKTIRVHKAWTLEHETPMQDVTIIIDEQMPQFPHGTTMEQCDAIFKAEAENIMEGLSQLPGGTMYQLLMLMLQNHPCRWIVPLPERVA